MRRNNVKVDIKLNTGIDGGIVKGGYRALSWNEYLEMFANVVRDTKIVTDLLESVTIAINGDSIELLKDDNVSMRKARDAVRGLIDRDWEFVHSRVGVGRTGLNICNEIRWRYGPGEIRVYSDIG